jgi:hypothetical protein
VTADWESAWGTHHQTRSREPGMEHTRLPLGATVRLSRHDPNARS